MTHRYGWGGEVQGGTAGQSSDKFYTYSNNRRTDGGFSYDNSGNLKFDGGQHFTYDATGQQTAAFIVLVSLTWLTNTLRPTAQSPEFFIPHWRQFSTIKSDPKTGGQSRTLPFAFMRREGKVYVPLS